MPDGRLALVTGASGFVGSHVTEALLERGWRVRCLVRRTSDLRWLPQEKVSFAHGDVGGDESGAGGESLRAAMMDVHAVFHLAALTSAPRDADYDRVNVRGTRRVAEAMTRAAPDARLIFCSSLSAAGPAGGTPLEESAPEHPVSAYGRSKLTAERALAASGARHVVIRPPAVYGPRDVDILEAFRLAQRGLAPRVAPRGQLLSMVHVRDLARGLVLAAEREASGTYYMSDGEVHTWEAITAGIAKALARRARVIPVPGTVVSLVSHIDRTRSRMTGAKPLLTPDRVRELSQRAWTCDDSKARRELGYTSEYTLAEGLADTALWYMRHGWLKSAGESRPSP